MKHVLSILGVLILAGCVVIPSKRVTFNDIKITDVGLKDVAKLQKLEALAQVQNQKQPYEVTAFNPPRETP